MEVKEEFSKAIKGALSKLDLPEIEPQIEYPNEFSHGDYATNVALIVVKKFGKNPIEVADYIVTELKDDKALRDLCDKIEAVPPGFINLWLSKGQLIRQLELALKDGEQYGTSKEGKNQTVVVEYSSPNIAKRFGIGHLRSTIIGQAIYNLYKFLGYKVVGENHLGDWGTQFGAILYQVKSSKFKVKSLTIDDLEKLYVDFNKAAAQDGKLWDEARNWFKKLEDGNEEAREIWKACVDVSLKDFQRIYNLLGIKFDNMHGESFYEDKMATVIEDAKKKNLAFEDKGALIIKVPGIETPLMLLKSDGATTYETRDLAAIKYRVKTWQPSKILYEIGAEQDLHFRLVFAAAKLLGYDSLESGKLTQFVHIKHGLYRLSGGKISTRLGTSVNLDDVLLEAITRAQRIIESSETSRNLLDKQKKIIARAVGIGAVKYFDLLHNPSSEIIFSWDKMFLLTGNSGPYLQYTHARAQSVLYKAGDYDLRFKIYDLQKEEIALLRTFYKFPEVIKDAAHQYAPNLLCNFLYDLASKYNIMYNNLPILEPKSKRVEEQGSVRNLRIALTAVTANILRKGLDLLGIQAPERM